jgi:purine-binding chemotaxis protein CheW
MEFGILADAIEGTQSVALEDILAAPHVFTGIGEKYLKGITKEHIIILEAENILNDEKIIINEEVI